MTKHNIIYADYLFTSKKGQHTLNSIKQEFLFAFDWLEIEKVDFVSDLCEFMHNYNEEFESLLEELDITCKATESIVFADDLDLDKYDYFFLDKDLVEYNKNLVVKYIEPKLPVR